MHEYSLMDKIMKSILASLEKDGGGPPEVKEVILSIGGLEMHSEESFRQAFTVLAREHGLANAALNLTIVPPRMECDCGHAGTQDPSAVDVHASSPAAPCPACGRVVLLKGGRGIQNLQLTL